MGDVLRTSFQALFANILVIGPMTALCLVPTIAGRYAFQILVQPHLQGEDFNGLFGSSLLFMLVTEVLKYFAEAAVTFVVVEHLAGRKVEIGHGLHVTFGRFLPITGTALLVTASVGFGAIFAFVPGIILACMMFVAVPACVVEGVGPFAAIGRSLKLTKGRLMPVFLVLATWLGIAVLTSLGGFVGVDWIGEILRTMLFAVMGAVVYVRLRGIRDGIDAVSMASVFE